MKPTLIRIDEEEGDENYNESHLEHSLKREAMRDRHRHTSPSYKKHTDTMHRHGESCYKTAESYTKGYLRKSVGRRWNTIHSELHYRLSNILPAGADIDGYIRMFVGIEGDPYYFRREHNDAYKVMAGTGILEKL